MYIRKTTRSYKSKTYTNHLLVESVQTPQGPRQRTLCSLGGLEPAPAEEWLALAHKLESSLQGQVSLPASPVDIEPLAEKARNGKQRTPVLTLASAIEVEPDGIEIEEAASGAVHAGHQMWGQLGVQAILRGAGLSGRACILTAGTGVTSVRIVSRSWWDWF